MILLSSSGGRPRWGQACVWFLRRRKAPARVSRGVSESHRVVHLNSAVMASGRRRSSWVAPEMAAVPSPLFTNQSPDVKTTPGAGGRAPESFSPLWRGLRCYLSRCPAPLKGKRLSLIYPARIYRKPDRALSGPVLVYGRWGAGENVGVPGTSGWCPRG